MIRMDDGRQSVIEPEQFVVDIDAVRDVIVRDRRCGNEKKQQWQVPYLAHPIRHDATPKRWR